MKGVKDKKTGRFIKNILEKECSYCQEKFHPRFSNRKFCSRICNALGKTKEKNRPCKQCGKVFWAKSKKTRFCSHVCYGKSIEKPISIKVKKTNEGSVMCKVCKKMFPVILYRVGKAVYCSYSCRAKYYKGEKSPLYKKDRTKIKIGDRKLNDTLQRQWCREVKNRDKWICRIADVNCDGKLEAHHILPWSKFPELRYQLNNGITLCHHHHPRKREDVEKLSPYFQDLVASIDKN